MAECKDTTDVLRKLASEDAQLRGELLATGVLLAQLLQSISKTQLSPHAFTTRIMSQAQEAVNGFKPEGDAAHAAAVKDAALKTIQHYEEQIRSVLPI